MVTQEIETWLNNPDLPEIEMVCGDVGREIRLTIKAREDSENPIDLENYHADIIIIKPDNTFVIETFDNNTVELPETAGAVSGLGYYQIKVYTDGTHQIYTGQGSFKVDDYILNDSVIESVAEVNGSIFPDDFATIEYVDDAISGLSADVIDDDIVSASKTWSSQKISHLTGVEDLDDLQDVTISAPSNGQALVYNNVTQKWENTSISISSTLDGLADVDITTPTDGQSLVYDALADKWINKSSGPITVELWSGSQISGDPGYLINLAGSISDYDFLIFKVSPSGSTQYDTLIYYVDMLTVGESYNRFFNSNITASAFWTYTSDTSITWISAFNAYPVNITKIVGVKL